MDLLDYKEKHNRRNIILFSPQHGGHDINIDRDAWPQGVIILQKK